MPRMRKMKRSKQITLVHGASNEFIRDVHISISMMRTSNDCYVQHIVERKCSGWCMHKGQQREQWSTCYFYHMQHILHMCSTCVAHFAHVQHMCSILQWLPHTARAFLLKDLPLQCAAHGQHILHMCSTCVAHFAHAQHMCNILQWFIFLMDLSLQCAAHGQHVLHMCSTFCTCVTHGQHMCSIFCTCAAHHLKQST